MDPLTKELDRCNRCTSPQDYLFRSIDRAQWCQRQCPFVKRCAFSTSKRIPVDAPAVRLLSERNSRQPTSHRQCACVTTGHDNPPCFSTSNSQPRPVTDRRHRPACSQKVCSPLCSSAKAGFSFRCCRSNALQKRLLFFVALLYLHLCCSCAQSHSYWKSASTHEVHARDGIDPSETISILGSGLIPGATDYSCSFRSDIVNIMRGEFEVRTSQMSVTSSTEATCSSPLWDLRSASTILEIYKSGAVLPKQVSRLVRMETLH